MAFRLCAVLFCIKKKGSVIYEILKNSRSRVCQPAQ